MADNVSAGAAINWLRYMEVATSWTRINLDNLGVLTLKATISGTSQVEGKSNTVHLNYSHEENIFDLWRSLRFGDNLQAWLSRTPGCPHRAVRTVIPVRNNNNDQTIRRLSGHRAAGGLYAAY